MKVERSITLEFRQKGNVEAFAKTISNIPPHLFIALAELLQQEGLLKLILLYSF